MGKLMFISISFVHPSRLLLSYHDFCVWCSWSYRVVTNYPAYYFL